MAQSRFRSWSEEFAPKVSVGIILLMVATVLIIALGNLTSNPVYAAFLGAVLVFGFAGPLLILSLSWNCLFSERRLMSGIGVLVLLFPVGWSIYALSGHVMLVP